MSEGIALQDVVIRFERGKSTLCLLLPLQYFLKVGGEGNENHWLKLGPGDSLWLHLITVFLYPNCLSKPQIGLIIVLLVVAGLESSLKICIILSGVCMKCIRIPNEVHSQVGWLNHLVESWNSSNFQKLFLSLLQFLISFNFFPSVFFPQLIQPNYEPLGEGFAPGTECASYCKTSFVWWFQRQWEEWRV